jgi:hypothetical protein
MSNNSSSVRIVAISWFSALVMNTLFGTALLTSLFTEAEMVGEYALMGFVFAILFTSPLAAVLFMCLRIFVRMEIVGRQLFVCYYLAGMLLTSGTFVIFSFTVFASFLPIWSLFLVAAISGSLGMLIEYRAVVQLRKQDDQSAIRNFLND